MDESVHTTKVYEYTVARDVLDSTLENLSFFKFRNDFLLLCFKLSFNKSLVADDNVAELLINLNHFELHGLSDKYVVVADGVYINLATGQECLDSKDVNNHTALRTALDITLNNLFVVKGIVDTLPAHAQTSLLVREQQLTFAVFLILNVHFDHVANLQVGVVAELAGGNNTVALVADVYDDFFFVNADNSTIDNLMFADFVQRFVVGLCQLFTAGTYS